MFPIIPVVTTAGIAGLGYLLFGKKDAASGAASSSPAANSAQAQQPTPSPRATQPTRPGVAPQQGQPAPSLPIPSLPSSVPVPSIPNVIGSSFVTGTVTAPSGVNLRAAPNTSGAIKQGLVYGTKVKMLSTTPLPATDGAPKGWYSVQAPSGGNGYVTAEWLNVDGAAGNSAMPVPIPSTANIPIPSVAQAAAAVAQAVAAGIPQITATVLGSPGANLRAAPSTTGAILAGLFNGSSVTVLDPTPTAPTAGAPNGWLKVAAPSGQTGYMSAQFLNVSGPHGEGDFGAEYGADMGVDNHDFFGTKQTRKRHRITG